MKMKKSILLFSVIVVLFSLTACAGEDEKVDFIYERDSIKQVSENLTMALLTINEPGRAYYENEGEEVFKTAIESFDKAKEEAGDFVDFKSQTVSEEGNTVVVNVLTEFSERDVEIQYIYMKDPAYAYKDPETTLPFQPKSITVSPVYSMDELMKKAAGNTLMGIGTVFVVLIFISFCISILKYIAMLANKMTHKSSDDKAENVKEMKAKVRSIPEAEKRAEENMDLTNDAQLVAVITAAIQVENESQAGNDQLVVRSIRRAGR